MCSGYPTAYAMTCDANGFTAIANGPPTWTRRIWPGSGWSRDTSLGGSEWRVRRTSECSPARTQPRCSRRSGATPPTGSRAGMPKIPGWIAKEREARLRAKPARARRAPDGRPVVEMLKDSGCTRYQRTHLVEFVDQMTGLVDARIGVAGRTKETPALCARIQIELDESVRTADTAHTCRTTAQAVIDAGGHYLLIVKRNTPRLFGAVAQILLPGPKAATTGQAHALSERGHSLVTRRLLRLRIPQLRPHIEAVSRSRQGRRQVSQEMESRLRQKSFRRSLDR